MLLSSRSKIYIAETIGTFLLVFFGTGAIIVKDLYPTEIDHLAVSLVFGAVVLAVIYALGEISGAHINPAVSIAFVVAGRLKAKHLPQYILAQLVGALMASILLLYIFPNHEHYGMTITGGHVLRAFVVEIILSFFLMLIIIHVATGSKEKGMMAGFAIGTAVFICALVGGPLTGASMNPARSIGPAIVSGNLTDLWVYLTAPIIGAILAILCWKLTKPKG